MYVRGSRTISAFRCFHIRAGRGREPISSLPAFVRKSTGAPYVCPDIISLNASASGCTPAKESRTKTMWEWEVKTHVVDSISLAILFHRQRANIIWVSWTGQHVELLLILTVSDINKVPRHFSKAAQSLVWLVVRHHVPLLWTVWQQQRLDIPLSGVFQINALAKKFLICLCQSVSRIS